MTDSTMAQENKTIKTPGIAIAGERRADRRYALLLDVKWKLVRRRRVLETGTGRTLDLSSSGILLDAGRQLPEGLNLELSVAWPVLLHNVAPLQLCVVGRIVRSDGRLAAIQMVQHEFRTAGISADQRGAVAGAARTPANLLTRVIAINGIGNPYKPLKP
jgi:hypothetical protein